MQSDRSQSTITVRVLFFGAARDAVGSDEIDFEIESPSAAAGARAQLLNAYPALQRFGNSLLFAVNQGDLHSEVRRKKRRCISARPTADYCNLEIEIIQSLAPNNCESKNCKSLQIIANQR